MQPSRNYGPDSDRRVDPRSTLLTKQAQVLLCLAQNPDVRLWEIGNAISTTERAAHRIVGELVASGYVSRERAGRRNRYTIEGHLPVPDRLPRALTIGELLAMLTGARPPGAQGMAPT